MFRWLLCAILSSAALAQVSEGPFVGAPITFCVGTNTLGPGSAPLDRNTLWVKRAGFFDLAPSTPLSGTLPNFTFDAMFGVGRPSDFRVDAFSSGFNYVFVDYGSGSPVLDIPTGGNRWGALLFSVTRTSPGGDAAAVVAEAARFDGAAGDVFSCILPGSTLPVPLTCVPIGVAQRANDSGEMGFESTVGSRPELTDFDPFLQLYSTSLVSAHVLPADPWVYFSLPSPMVDPPTPQPYVASWFQTRGGLVLPVTTPSGATILRTRWQSTGMPPAWTTPEVFLTYVELGLNQGDDIDALAVDETGRVVLSLRRTAVRNGLGEQLMVAQFAFGGATGVTAVSPAQPYLYDAVADGLQPVAKLAGAGGGGDIDATCELDPANGVGSLAMAFVRACRTDVPFGTTMHASVFATTAASPAVASYAVSVTGLPVTFSTALYGLLLGFPGPQGASLPLASAVTLGIGVVPGPVLTLPWSLPRGPQGGAWGAQMDFQWAALDGASVTLARLVRIGL